ncbi:YihY family inner membrane protein [Aestuariispira ectoiniformans]|uniref:YihY family inner membrane protein n=1 Tax=Aestuariispira ectoiniformans TaxID=2775080 RepID=UPI00223B54F1|nr:YihY family inner membrane protein [Aestuariispira ectoiniformans]
MVKTVAQQPEPAPKRPQKTPSERSGFLRDIVGFTSYVFQRFAQDGMQQKAAALTFTSLLALVPLLAISFAIFAAFPAFERIKGQVHSFLFQNFIPEVGSTVQQHLESFTAKTGSLTAIGVIFLGVTAIMLLMTISNTFNEIWRAKRQRGVVSRLLVFWALLTLAPLFFGASLSISSYLFTLAQASGVESYTGELARLAGVLPFLLQACGFTILFLVVPNFPVSRMDAVIGGIIASTLLELLKRAFGLYVTSFPTYQTIYGAMATIPIFLMWVYFSWNVVLFSAELTAALPEWRSGGRQLNVRNLSPIAKLEAALAVLDQLNQASKMGTGIGAKRLSTQCRLGPSIMTWALNTLEDRKYVIKGDNGRWHLSRDLDQRSLRALADELGVTLLPNLSPAQAHHPWAHRLRAQLTVLREDEKDLMDISLKQLLANKQPHEDFPETAPVQVAAPEPAQKSTTWKRIVALITLGALSSTQ